MSVIFISGIESGIEPRFPGYSSDRLPALRGSAGIGWLGAGLLASVWTSTALASAEEDRWASVISRVADSVVSLQLSQLRSFDDVEQGGSNATGFVVDAERGIVLTNRHVMGSGPIRISATFQNQEQVDAVPLYRDPIRDFAFLRYKPEDLKYARPVSLPLRPDKVDTGMSIRVIGSDGGEQLSILPGTIARLDREVPSYGRYGYNDFNTFYLQAASGTSGGSSGSPVIDVDGDVVALNAAANTKTASSFFLPLPRIKHALERLQEGASVDRGGFQTLFEHRPFRELRRLGLDEISEAQVRDTRSGTTGLLTVGQVIPGGTADGLLEPGDILFSVAGTVIVDFISLEALLDSAIHQHLDVELIRQGDRLSFQVEVADLNALAPSAFLELGDSILQDMSIQHARAMNRAQDGVVLMRAGYIFSRADVPKGALIIELDDRPVTDINSFIEAINASAGTLRKRIRYIEPGREFSTELAQIQLDDRWFGNRSCQRQDDVRFWNCQPLALPAVAQLDFSRSVAVPGYQDVLLDKVSPAIVRVDFSAPYSVDNIYARKFQGAGIVVDTDEGLVAVDRNTVPVGLGDVDITFFGSLVVPGEVVFLHPRHNIALVRYDVSRLNGATFEALRLSAAGEAPPSLLTMIGLRADGTFRRHAIEDISRLTIGFDPPSLPRFQQAMLDVYSAPNVPPSLGGPLVDESGKVHALHMSFAYEDRREIRQQEWAMPASVILESLRIYRSNVPYYSLDARLSYQPISKARMFGLPDEWLQRYDQLPADMRRVLHVTQLVPGTDAAEKLLTGDLILAIDDQLVSELLAAEMLAQKPELRLTVLRSGVVSTLTLMPSAMNALGTRRIVSWSGAIFEDPFVDIGFQKAVDFPGVYIAHTENGSPALWDSLYRNRFVVAVDGEPVQDLDDFLAFVTDREQDQITRLTVVSMSGRKDIVTVQPEYNFWPSFEVKHTENGWQRIDHPPRTANPVP